MTEAQLEYQRQWRKNHPESRKKSKEKWNTANPEKVREYKRNSYHRRYPNNRNKLLKRYAAYRRANPEKKKAQSIVGNAIRAGKFSRQPCVKCGKNGQAHHQNYSKPLEVTWLCASHHKQAHLEG